MPRGFFIAADMRTPLFIILATIFAGALALAIYWPGLHGSFFFDDGPSILLAEGVRLKTLSVESLMQALFSGHSGPSGRPVAQLSFALNHYFSSFSPFAFKATNLAIHGACAFLAFFLALRLLTGTGLEAKCQEECEEGAGKATKLCTDLRRLSGYYLAITPDSAYLGSACCPAHDESVGVIFDLGTTSAHHRTRAGRSQRHHETDCGVGSAMATFLL